MNIILKRIVAGAVSALVMLTLITVNALAYNEEFHSVCSYDAANNLIKWQADYCTITVSGNKATDFEYAYGKNKGITGISFPGTIKVKMVGLYDYAYANRLTNGMPSDNLFTINGHNQETNEIELTEGEYMLSFASSAGEQSSGDWLKVTIGKSANKPVPVPVQPSLTATPTTSTVYVNGEWVRRLNPYNINDNNYFMLRDIAYVLNGTEKQFEVSWDAANNAINLTSGAAYTEVGGEMGGKGLETKTPTPTNSKILLDGKEVSFTAYNIEGNNYFKLRDVGAALDFNVSWDAEKNAINIITAESYTND